MRATAADLTEASRAMREDSKKRKTFPWKDPCCCALR